MPPHIGFARVWARLSALFFFFSTFTFFRAQRWTEKLTYLRKQPDSEIHFFKAFDCHRVAYNRRKRRLGNKIVYAHWILNSLAGETFLIPDVTEIFIPGVIH